MAARWPIDVAVAAGVGGWAMVYLRPGWSPRAAAAVAVAMLCALLWRRPRVCLVLGLAANIVAAVTGVGIDQGHDENSWNVAMAVVVGVSLGAFERVRFAAGGVLLLGLSVTMLDPPHDAGLLSVVEILWPTLPIGGTAALARSVTRARRRACAERSRVGALAATTPQQVARLAVAHERERLLADVQAVLRTAVSSMLAHAETAAAASDPTGATGHARAIQRAGRDAVTELRLLLGQMRSPTTDEPAGDIIALERSPGRSWSQGRLNACLTASVIVLAMAEVWLWPDFDPPLPAPTLFATILTAVAAAGVALRGTHPALGAAGLGGFLTISAVFDLPVAFGFAVLGTMLALTWAALAHPGLWPVAAVAVLLAGAVAYVTPQSPNLSLLVVSTLATAVASAGTAHHRGAADSNAAYAVRLAGDRRAASAEAVHAERLAVARELHDVVSHAVVVMTVQAGAAESLLPTDPAAARAALERVRAVGSSTLAELDRLFDTLSGGITEPVAPVSYDLPALVHRMRAGGLAVQYRAPADPPVDPLVFRVVQESLTNTLRHAPDAAVHVSITTAQQATTVEVVDDGPGPTPGAPRGYGLVGITERVEHAGGHVETGPGRYGRGFRVLARIPTTRTQVST